MSGNNDKQKAHSGVHSNFAHAAPDSNVNPPGAAQSSAGSIAGQQDVPGGVSSQIQASRNAQSSQNGSASRARPGTPSDGSAPDDRRSVVNSSGGAGMDRDS